MLEIKLSRTGKSKQPYYRLVVLEKNRDPWGDYLELLGNYNPRTKELTIKEDRIKYWLSVGATTSNTVHNLLLEKKIIEGKAKKSIKLSNKRRAKLADKKKADEDARLAAEQAAAAKAEEKSEPVAETTTPETTEVKEEAPVEATAAETTTENVTEVKEA